MGFLPIMVLTFLCFSQITRGRMSKWELEEEDSYLEKQLKILNKPPVVTYQANGLDVVDCINITSQPALDHPLLKDHKIQMKPGSFPKQIRKKIRDPNLRLAKGDRSIICPEGTVPIRRTSKRDLIAARELFKPFQPSSDSVSPGHHVAVVKSVGGSPGKFYGVAADISVRNVRTADRQLSSALMAIHNKLDAIHFGWAVSPHLYGDNLTRTFSVWTADGFQKTGCFNSLCSGFVQVSRKHYMGQAIPPSEYGNERKQFILGRLIYKDPHTGSWWLLADFSSEEKGEVVGYWPKSIFTDMAEYGTQILLGGDVYAPKGQPYPAMGSGDFNDDYTKTCFIGHIQLVDFLSFMYEPATVKFEASTDKPCCYQVTGEGFTGEFLRYAMLFGGPACSCSA